MIEKEEGIGQKPVADMLDAIKVKDIIKFNKGMGKRRQLSDLKYIRVVQQILFYTDEVELINSFTVDHPNFTIK